MKINADNLLEPPQKENSYRVLLQYIIVIVNSFYLKYKPDFVRPAWYRDYETIDIEWCYSSDFI